MITLGMILLLILYHCCSCACYSTAGFLLVLITGEMCVFFGDIGISRVFRVKGVG